MFNFIKPIESFQVKSYLSSLPPSALNVVCLTHEDCRTFGDAMRDLDAKAVLRGDFVLVRGDTVANVDLKEVIQEHK